jgi:cyanophycinase
MEEVDRRLLEGRPPKAAFLPTAAGEEGEISINRWLRMGTEHYERLGVEPVPVPVIDAASASDPACAAAVKGAGLIYLSGGNPGYVARVLRDTPVWAAIIEEWRQGAALAGCSAGAGALTAIVHDVRRRGVPAEKGLGVVPHLAVIPHYDRMARWAPQLPKQMLREAGPGVTVVGIDEETALVGGPEEWRVEGRQSVWVLHDDGARDEHPSGSVVLLGS